MNALAWISLCLLPIAYSYKKNMKASQLLATVSIMTFIIANTLDSALKDPSERRVMCAAIIILIISMTAYATMMRFRWNPSFRYKGCTFTLTHSE